MVPLLIPWNTHKLATVTGRTKTYRHSYWWYLPTIQHFLQEKTAYLPLSEKWFIEIGQGKKSIEVRAHTKYWATRLKGATTVLFSNGYTSQKLPPKKILSMDVTDWNGLKGLSLPQPGSKEYQKLFGAATEFLRIEFEKFNPGEVPQDRSSTRV